MKIVSLGLVVIMILVASMMIPIAMAQEVPPHVVPPHVVISEIYIEGTNDWIELYNPTNEDINLSANSYRLERRTATGSTTDVFMEIGKSEHGSYPGGTIIPAHGFYLIVRDDANADSLAKADAIGAHNKFTLTDSNSIYLATGSISNPPDDINDLDLVDLVGYGTALSYEGSGQAPAPPDGKNIERNNLSAGYAPSQDTNNNSFDFFVQDTPTPMNSSSPKMNPAPVEIFKKTGNFTGGFKNIQDAVNNASSYYTIRVDDGTYHENVVVSMHNLTIQSENGSANCIVNASDSNDHVFHVTADYVNISGFTVQNATAWTKVGISLDNVDHCNISDSNVTNNWYGIHLNASSNNILTSNTASNNTDYDFYSDENSHNNTVKDLSISSYPTTISFTYDNGIGIKSVTTLEPDPAGKVNISKYVNATNVTADSWIFLNVSYTNAEITGVQESTLRMWKYNGTWTEVPLPNGVNTAENYVYANITEFSIFAPLGNGPTLTLGNVTNITQKWGRDFNLNHSVTVTHANASNVKVSYNVSWISKCTRGTVNRSETKWCNHTISNYTVQNITVRANATTTNASANNDSKTFWINITGRDIGIVANPEATQTVDPDVTFWINGSAKDEYGDELIGKADLIREGFIVETKDIVSGNVNFSRTEPLAGTFNFSIRFYNLTHYKNATTSNATVTVAAAPLPNITSFAPPSPVNDTVCTWRTFNVTVNQTVNVSWYLNETFLFTNESIKEANCTLHAEVAGEHNVSVIAANANGTDMQMWIWNVTGAPLPPSPLLCTTPDPPSHDFGIVPPSQTRNWDFEITNCGDPVTTLTWNVTASEPWISVSPSSGTNTAVTVTIDTRLPDGGVKTGTITVNSNGGTKTGVIRVNIEIETAPETGYATFATTGGYFDSVEAVAENTLPEEKKPPDMVFPHGFFSFNIAGLAAGQSVTVTIVLPSDMPADAEYWKYGPTPDNPTDHWYKFMYDGQTGAEINGNLVTLHFVDGLRGDDDPTPDGKIIDPGGPGSSPIPVPEFNAVGLLSLIGILSVVLAVATLRKRKE